MWFTSGSDLDQGWFVVQELVQSWFSFGSDLVQDQNPPITEERRMPQYLENILRISSGESALHYAWEVGGGVLGEIMHIILLGI